MKKLKNHTFLFDVDDTLIYTNLTNFLSYKRAIFEVTGRVLSEGFLKNRCDRRVLQYLNLDEQTCFEIARAKERYFKEYIKQTSINKKLFKLMQSIQKESDVFIVTNVKESRINLMFEFYNLKNLPQIYINKSGNKYQNCIAEFGLNARDIVAFDDELTQISHAKKAGIITTFKI